MIRYGTDKKKTHRASIILGFYSDSVVSGFDLTHSINEGKILSKMFQNDDECKYFSKKIMEFDEYYIYAPNTGFINYFMIDELEEKAMKLLLKNYNPIKQKDSYFRITNDYKNNELSFQDAANLLLDEHDRFKFIFDALKLS